MYLFKEDQQYFPLFILPSIAVFSWGWHRKMVSNVMIFASDLAACIGRHPYNPRPDAVLRCLQRNFPEHYAKLKADTGKQTVRDATDAALEKLKAADRACHQNLTSAIATVAEKSAASSEYASTIQKQCTQALRTAETFTGSLCEKEIALVKEEVRRIAATTLGSSAEAFVAENWSKQSGKRVVKDDVFSKRLIGHITGPDGSQIPVFVGGKCDGITMDADGNKTIVEIKNRAKRLFYRLQDYEFVQVMAYLFIWDIGTATLIERFQDKTRDYHITFDQTEWELIQAAALDCAAEVLSLVSEYAPEDSD